MVLIGKKNRIKILTKREIDLVHQATLEVLESTGVMFYDEEARKILREAGARVSHNGLTRIPASLVENALASAPKQITLHARDPNNDIVLNGDSVYYTNGFGAPYVIDLETELVRPAMLTDLERFTRLADYLSNVDFCLIEVVPADLSPETIDLELAALVLTNTTKHVHVSTYDDSAIDAVIDLGMVISGSNSPVFSLGCCPLSPLVYPKDASQRLIKAVRRGIPFFIVSGAVAGNSSPVTLAGTLVAQNAEILAGIVLAQLVKPSAPVVYGTFAGPMDMRTGKQLLGSPELPLISAASAQLCREYGIPFGYGTGGVADAVSPSCQAGVEKALSVLFGTLAGVNVVHDAVSGLLASATIASYEQMLLDNEICSMVRRLSSGIEVEEETLAVELIHEVGPGGTFLTSRHTLRNFRKELLIPKLFCAPKEKTFRFRQSAEVETARAMVREILDSHEVEPISSKQRTELDRIISNHVKTIKYRA